MFIVVLYLIFGTIVLIGGGVPVVAILTEHRQKTLELKLDMVNKELELEQMKLTNYQVETEKLKLELDHSKKLLLENTND